MVECGDSRPRLSRSEAPSCLCGAGAPARVRGASRGSFRRNRPHRIQHPIRRIHPIQILRHLGAQKPARNRMLRIPLNPRRPPILHGNQNPASIGAVVRTSGMDDLFHRVIIGETESAGPWERWGNDCGTGLRPGCPSAQRHLGDPYAELHPKGGQGVRASISLL